MLSTVLSVSAVDRSCIETLTVRSRSDFTAARYNSVLIWSGAFPNPTLLADGRQSSHALETDRCVRQRREALSSSTSQWSD
eukprot:1499389-Pleurochrysis_carterae.AAC.1